mgnify:CR=1 FL=1
MFEESKRLSQQKASQESDYTRDYNEKIEVDTLDYCPIRHRTGIERLLQIIEGKDPRLDSAPKVWTLAVLAKHFECHNAVVDYIVTWMIAEPNCKIFEILPEDCLRIGIMLQNEVATRYAFTILVSEEAFRIGTGRSDAANQPNTNYPAGKQVTKFGRARESLDEDTLKRRLKIVGQRAIGNKAIHSIVIKNYSEAKEGSKEEVEEKPEGPAEPAKK